MTVILAATLLSIGAIMGFGLCAILTVSKQSDRAQGEDDEY